MEDLLREYEELYLRHIEVLNRLEELEAEIKARARAEGRGCRGLFVTVAYTPPGERVVVDTKAVREAAKSDPALARFLVRQAVEARASFRLRRKDLALLRTGLEMAQAV